MDSGGQLTGSRATPTAPSLREPGQVLCLTPRTQLSHVYHHENITHLKGSAQESNAITEIKCSRPCPDPGPQRTGLLASIGPRPCLFQSEHTGSASLTLPKISRLTYSHRACTTTELSAVSRKERCSFFTSERGLHSLFAIPVPIPPWLARVNSLLLTEFKVYLPLREGQFCL